MKNLVKIGLNRLTKSIVYIIGCILAFVITNRFIVACPIPQLAKYDPNSLAILVSGAITIYFSFFVGFFIGNDNEDGILRNKVMVGHSQLSIYFANYITFIVSLAVMMVFWIAGALVSGSKLDSSLLTYIAVSFFANAAFIALVQSIVFRAKKMIIGIVISMGIAYAFVGSVLMGNFFYMITDGQASLQKLVIVIYNISALGQCFARTSMSDPGLAITPVQLGVSLALIIAASFIGTLGLKKRDIN